MNIFDKLAGLVQFHGQHNQKDHGNWARGMGDEGDDLYVNKNPNVNPNPDILDFSDTFDGFYDPHGMTDGENGEAIKTAGAAALAAIDQVHGLEDDWPKVIAMVDNGEFLGEDDGSLGAYMPPEPGEGGEPPIERGRIVFRGSGDVNQMTATLVHEFGHHASLAWGVGDFRQEMNEEGSPLFDLLAEIKESGSYKDLVKIRENVVKAKDDNALGFVDYLLMPEELFARAYAQYIGIKTQHPMILGYINEVLGANDAVMQWYPDDFDGIYGKMNDYFRRHKLLRQ